METLMKRMKEMKTSEISETLDKVFDKYYTDKGMDVPNWRIQRNDDWFLRYCEELKRQEEDTDYDGTQ